jgi:hypothetical protein
MFKNSASVFPLRRKESNKKRDDVNLNDDKIVEAFTKRDNDREPLCCLLYLFPFAFITEVQGHGEDRVLSFSLVV